MHAFGLAVEATQTQSHLLPDHKYGKNTKSENFNGLYECSLCVCTNECHNSFDLSSVLVSITCPRHLLPALSYHPSAIGFLWQGEVGLSLWHPHLGY